MHNAALFYLRNKLNEMKFECSGSKLRMNWLNELMKPMNELAGNARKEV